MYCSAAQTQQSIEMQRRLVQTLAILLVTISLFVPSDASQNQQHAQAFYEDEVYWSRFVQESSFSMTPSPTSPPSSGPSSPPSPSPTTPAPTAQCLVDVSLIATSYLIAFRILWTNDLMILRSRSTALLQVVFLVQS